MAVSGITSTNQNEQSSLTNSSANSTASLANQSTFLQLFVAQLKNQDPLNPAQGTEFISQLAQFSQLEQTLAISGNVTKLTNQIVPQVPTESK